MSLFQNRPTCLSSICCLLLRQPTHKIQLGKGSSRGYKHTVSTCLEQLGCVRVDCFAILTLGSQC